MQSVTRTLARRYEADPESVGRARAELAGFASRAGASPKLVDGVRMAVSEAVTNVVQHAYPLESGEIRVRALAENDVLKVVVSDDGCGVHRDRTRSGGLGLGLALICEVSDQMTLAPRSHGGVDLRMRFNLPESGSGAAVGRL
jgi:anti-sigma regulatory factor (Ser/Thr protein kinase)